MRVSIIVATCGDDRWAALAHSHAVQSARAQHPYELVIEHDPAGTISGVRNYAARVAHEDWLCFLDADDQLADGYIAAMGQRWMEGAITSDWAPLLVPAVQYVDEAGTPFGRAEVPNAEPARPLYEINVACIGTLVRRDLFLNAGGFPEEPIYEDWALWLACHYDHGAQIVHVPDAVYRATRHEGSRNQRAEVDAGEVYWRYRNRYEGRVPA